MELGKAYQRASTWHAMVTIDVNKATTALSDIKKTGNSRDYHSVVSAAIQGMTRVEITAKRELDKAKDEFARNLVKKMRAFNKASTTPSAVVTALGELGYRPVEDAVFEQLCAGNPSRDRAANHDKSMAVFAVDSKSDKVFFHPEKGHHLVMQFESEAGILLKYFGGEPTKVDNALRFTTQNARLFDLKNSYEQLVFREQVCLDPGNPEHVDDCIARLRRTIDYLEFCKHLAYKIPFFAYCDLQDHPKFYTEIIAGLAEQAACGTPIEIRRVTRHNRHGKRVTYTALHVDDTHRRDDLDQGKVDIESTCVGRIMVDEP